MQFPIGIGLHRSRFLGALILANAALTTLVAAFFPVLLLIRLGLACLVWGLAFWAWLGAAPPFAGLRLERDGGVSILRHGATDYESVSLLPGATVHPWLCIVRLKTGDGRHHRLIVAGDTPAVSEFRRLRVFLRWRADFVRPSGDGA